MLPFPIIIATLRSVIAWVLTGTSGSPNVSNDNRSTDPSGFTARAGWAFNTDGTVDYYVAGSWTQWTNSPPEWWDGATIKDTWVRFTLDSGSSPDNGTFGSWLKVGGSGAANRSFFHDEVVGALATYSRAGTVKVELANDAGGTNIKATGYYRYNIFVAP